MSGTFSRDYRFEKFWCGGSASTRVGNAPSHLKILAPHNCLKYPRALGGIGGGAYVPFDFDWLGVMLSSIMLIASGSEFLDC
jgi:hypothetical protein